MEENIPMECASYENDSIATVNSLPPSHSDLDGACAKLLAMSESLRDSFNIREAIHCLIAIVAADPSSGILAKAYTNLGALYLKYSDDISLAQSQFQSALQICLDVPELQLDEIRFHAASMLADSFLLQEDCQTSRDIICRALKILPESAVFWKCRLTFQLANVMHRENDVEHCIEHLDVGVECARQSLSQRTEALFLLSKAMVLLGNEKAGKAHEVLNLVRNILLQWKGSTNTKDEMKIFFLSIQVLHFLSVGQAKTALECLGQLQDCVKGHTTDPVAEPYSQNTVDYFQWMSKEYMAILCFLITAAHAVLSGQLERAQKYIERALKHHAKCKLWEKAESLLLQKFYVIILEYRAACYIISGSKTKALKTIFEMCGACSQSPLLMHNFEAQLHTLLGMYSLSLTLDESAEQQFSAALRLARRKDLWLLNNMNLAIVYLRRGKESDFYALLERIAPERLTTNSQSLMSAAFFVRGLQSFLQSRYHEAKKFLREALRVSTEQSLDRLTCCSLVLLGHIFSSESNCKESMKMVTPALKIANKTPDLHVQIWACALMKDLHKLNNENEEATKMTNRLNDLLGNLKSDHYSANSANEHTTLVQWTDGDCPVTWISPSPI